MNLILEKSPHKPALNLQNLQEFDKVSKLDVVSEVQSMCTEDQFNMSLKHLKQQIRKQKNQTDLSNGMNKGSGNVQDQRASGHQVSQPRKIKRRKKKMRN